MNGHLTSDDLLNRLYGLAGDDAHLESCADCARRWSDLRARREQYLRHVAAGQESSEFLAAQRSRIHGRLSAQDAAASSRLSANSARLRKERKPRLHLPWVPAGIAAACLLAVGLFMHRPAAPPRAETADVQLFSDVYSMQQSLEPLAAAPIHGLFEERQ